MAKWMYCFTTKYTLLCVDFIIKDIIYWSSASLSLPIIHGAF